ncbi:MAG: lactococcin 972 family bacteriocin [Peptostreptococcus porci]|uniref:lactococcin 972 family bacteriocin n=1 Tax=Peptostreptococcus porci TaxID=2652282 RepID=UPI0023F51FF9|nr:lactococcin 972 family bacteriocin [Peptostreptococcus porci]MDD7182502.1 lactococcin 972 family bacteriocin [Peptostreptococcus porci]MDY4127247.1 lactococcin 972 family bacteriocin [Peptostreptococcus porci]MDY5478878.1 lactococcin 972 family bacteriocin [Peptostreptococcus porci]MDY5964518.1 lactococcin 972 family bacteriocin [Peptostreptococcus porci]
MKLGKFFAIAICSTILVLPIKNNANAVSNDEIITVKKFGTVEKTAEGAFVEMDALSTQGIALFSTGSTKVTGSGESWVGGGKWTYGLSSTNLWSRFVNNERIHGTRVKNSYGVREHRGVKKGVHAIASIQKATSGNYAYVYFD